MTGYGATSDAGDFTMDAYRRFLDTATSLGYGFRSFDELPGPGRSIHLRHDIDNSIRAALPMAVAERDRDVRSTYFVMVRSNNYNPLSPSNADAIRQILDLGHWIGLHHVVAPESGRNNVPDEVRKDAEVLGDLTGRPVTAFSFHNPSVVGGSTVAVTGLVNAYSATFFTDIAYLSESNMRWRDGPPDQVLRLGGVDQLQILVHPFSYVADLRSDRDVLLRFLTETCRDLIAENSTGVRSLEDDPLTLVALAHHLLEPGDPT